MAVSSSCSYVYAEGSLLGSDKDWYHGQLTRVEAEQALRASGCDCFLIRHERRTLIVSLVHHGQVHHVNIKYGPGRYELESGSTIRFFRCHFTELDELVSHYRSNTISKLGLKLGPACAKMTPHYEVISESPSETSPYYETISNGSIYYSIGKPTDLMKYSWYHGNITEEQANAALSTGNNNTFLIRQSITNLILSKRVNGWKSHDTIHCSPKGYRLEGKETVFKTVSEMIAHYQQFPIKDNSKQVLGSAIDKQYSERELEASNSASLFKKSESLLKVSWRRGADMPAATASSPIVKIGDNVYVGCGLRKQTEELTIFKYSTPRGTWSRLPDCPTYHHGLTTLDEELIVIGGKLLAATNVVYTFRGDAWREILPPMPTPRYSLSTLSHENDVIVAAGGITGRKSDGEYMQTDVVEIYKKDSDSWHGTKRLPFPTSNFSMTILEGKCYVLGGIGESYSDSCTVLYATVSSLLANAVSVNKPLLPMITWKKLRDKHPLTFPSLVELDGRLLAMGGSAEQQRRLGTKFIGAYDFATDTWVECKGAELPLPLYRPGVVKLDDYKVMLIGGQTKSQQFSKAVYLGCYYKPRHS